MKWEPKGTEWSDNYNDTNYSKKGLEHKKNIVNEFLDEIKPATIWDLGANTGVFSRIATNKGINTISFDIDPAAVEINYLTCKKNQETNILPLILDLSNPSPASGWANEERMSLTDRGPVETILALALIHHLIISNNVPIPKIAEFFNKFCNSLIIEFVPKTDSQVQRLLVTREDIFTDYTNSIFEEEFGKYYTVLKKVEMEDSERIIYLMRKKIE